MSKMKTKDEPKNVDFDDLLPHIGEFGKYQKYLFALMIPFAFFLSWVYFSQIFITLVPENYWCLVPELMDLPLEERLALSIPLEHHDDELRRARCVMYDVNYTEIKNLPKTADPKWPIKPCDHGWEFDHSVVPYKSISVEMEWVCDNAALPTIAQSIFFVGAIFGGLIFGWIADRYGRIPALVGSNLIGMVSGIITIFSTNFWQFCVCRFFDGFAFDNCFTMIYILVLEYVGPKWRTFVANMSSALFFTLAVCTLPWIAYFIADWRMMCLATSVPLALAILTPCLIPESARWLISQGKVDKAMVILRKIERINNKNVPEKIYTDFMDTCTRMQKREEAGRSYSVIDLFKTPRLRNITILLTLIWMSMSLVFDGHIRIVDNLRLNVFATFTVAAATELPADVLLTVILDRWGRRWVACLSMAISGFFSIWAALVTSDMYTAVLALMGRFFVNISYNTGMQYAAELLPTVVRVQGVALIHIMGYVASIIAPFVVFLGAYSRALPLLVLGVLGIIGSVLSLLLPETLNKQLPQTIQDGEDFGRDQGFCDMPCFMKKADALEGKLSRSSTFRHSGRAGSINREVFKRGMVGSSSLRSRKSVDTLPDYEVTRL